jgi:hypothetical protein
MSIEHGKELFDECVFRLRMKTFNIDQSPKSCYATRVLKRAMKSRIARTGPRCYVLSTGEAYIYITPFLQYTLAPLGLSNVQESRYATLCLLYKCR